MFDQMKKKKNILMQMADNPFLYIIFHTGACSRSLVYYHCATH